MLAVVFLALFLPLAIGLGLTIKSLPLFIDYPPEHFVSSSDWSPMNGKFGFYPFILSSLWVTVLSFLIAAPLSLLAAIYLTQFAARWMQRLMHPIIDMLSGIPSVVYGVWGVLVVVPFVGQWIAPFFGRTTVGYNILSGAIVLAVMSVPYILNLLIEVFRQIPIELKEASLSLGATHWQTIKKVLIRQGMSGIFAAFGLGISKALGETIAVLMVVGNVVQVPKSVFDPGYPLPALIANNYGEMMSIPLYDAALMLAALILFVVVFLFNLGARYLIQKTDFQ